MANENAVTKWNSDIENKTAYIDNEKTSEEDLKKLDELEVQYTAALKKLEKIINLQNNLASVKGIYDRMTIIDMLNRCKLN